MRPTSTSLWRTLLWMGMVLGAIGASEQSAHAQRYVFDSYDERQGLPSPDIQAVTQDTHGALWIVSRAGVARYDGHTWEAHPTAMGGIGKTGDLHPGRDGTLWLVSSKGQGSIYQWDGETWSSVPLPEGRPPASSILTTVEGEEVLFVGRPAPSASLIRRGGRWQPVALDIVPVALSPTSNGVLIAHEEGLDRLDLVTHTRTPVAGVPRVFIRATLNDPETGQTWVVTRDWIGRVDAEGFTLLAEPLPLAQRRTKLELERDGHGGLFLGDREGLIHFSTSEGIERLDRRSGHNAGTAADLHLDRERNLWVASSRGLSKLRTLHLVGMDTEHGLLDDEVSAILHRRDGTTVLGHKTGLTFLEPKPRTLRLRDDGIDARVMDFAEDESGTLWIAAAFLGVGRLAPSGELEWIPRVSETMRQVMALHFDTEGTLWVGGQPGLGTVTAAGFVPHPSMRDMELTVRSMTGCGDRLLLATRERGAFEVDGDTLVPLQPEQGVVDAFSVLCPADNSRWIGAIDGLSVLGGELPPQLMLAQPVYALAQSYDGAIWIGSNDGLRRWKDGQLRHLSAEDGLLGAEANRHALAFDPTGRVWFGTDRGLNVYRPHYDTPRPQGPTVQIASASADAQPLSLVAPTTLDTERNSLSFQLGAIAFANEDEVRFRSRLEPLEDALSEPVLLPTRELRYPYLPPGTYRLHVRAVTASGMESTTVSSPPITFRAPLLQRPLIRLAGGTLLALAILLLSILLAQRRYAEWLEAAVRRRTTELETSRAALVAESERLGALLSSIQDAVVVLDPNGRVTLWNNAAARLLEVPVAHAMGAPLEDLLGFAEPEDGEFEFQTPDGSVRMLEMTCASIQEGHQEGGRVLALRDITARRRMEADQRRSSQLESLGLLAAGIAHDFNNLLTILLGNINLAQDTLGKDDFLEDAVQAVEQAESLTKQLLTFSKGGAPICQTTSIVELIRESVNFVLHGSTVRPVYAFPDDLWNVDVDAGQMGQVVQNLALNAREVMPEGGTITFSGENLASGPPFLPEGRYIAISVTDEGPGIEPDNVQRIFDPYFSTKQRGSGLGLTTSYSIIERHGGRLRVSSTGPGGTTFQFYLPSSQGTVREATEPSATELATPLRILVLDDDEPIRNMLREMLSRAGHVVETYADGVDVVDRYREGAAQEEPFDLLLLDLTIPDGCGGLEALNRLRSFDPDVRAIVASGYCDDPILADPRQHGFAAALSKPFSSRQVLTLASQVMAPPR